MSDPLLHAESYTSGFLRNDASSRVDDKWVRAQVWPIGTCFKEKKIGGSANVAKVYINSSHIVGLTNSYYAPDCTGQYFSEVFALLIVQANEEFKNVVSYVTDIEAALDVRSEDTDGLIFSTYYSAEGCAGQVAQYDLFSTNDRTLYDIDIGSDVIIKCDEAAELLVQTLYGSSQDIDNETTDETNEGTIKETSDSEIKKDYSGRPFYANLFEESFRCAGLEASADLPLSTYYHTVRCVRHEKLE
eukprot:gene19577-22257_t